MIFPLFFHFRYISFLFLPNFSRWKGCLRHGERHVMPCMHRPECQAGISAAPGAPHFRTSKPSLRIDLRIRSLPRPRRRPGERSRFLEPETRRSPQTPIPRAIAALAPIPGACSGGRDWGFRPVQLGIEPRGTYGSGPAKSMLSRRCAERIRVRSQGRSGRWWRPGKQRHRRLRLRAGPGPFRRCGPVERRRHRGGNTTTPRHPRRCRKSRINHRVAGCVGA